MPIEYEFEAVDSPIRAYASKTEYVEEDGWGLEVIVQPESGIQQFDKHIVEYITEAFEDELEASLELSDTNAPVITGRREPHQVEVYVTVRNGEYSVVEIGQVVGEALLVAEKRVTESVDVDNGDFNMGLASVLYDDE